MSGEDPVLALPTGLTPLSSGPIPLTRWQGLWAALAVLLSTLALSAGLPWLAGTLAPAVREPDRIVFGTATVVPAPGWSQGDPPAPTALRLTKGSTWIEFASVPARGQSAAVRVLELGTTMQRAYPQLTVSSSPRPFPSASRTPGQLQALAGTNQTAIVASIVEAEAAVDVTSLGESSQFSKDIGDIQAMLESIRILPGPDG